MFYSVSEYCVAYLTSSIFMEGLSPSSATGFACLGSYLAQNSNLVLGRHLTSLAQSLIRQSGCKQVAGQVLVVISEVRSFLEPLLAANELRIEGMKSSESVGDINHLCVNRLMYEVTSFHAGICLSTVIKKLNRASQFLKQHEHNFSFVTASLMERSVRKLSGRDDDDEFKRLNDIAERVKEGRAPRLLMKL